VLEDQLVLTMRLLLREENPSNSRSRAKDFRKPVRLRSEQADTPAGRLSGR